MNQAVGGEFDKGLARLRAVQYDTIDQAHSAFHALSQGGQVTMPLALTFWAQTFGMLTDRFGVAWAINGAPVDMAR